MGSNPLCRCNPNQSNVLLPQGLKTASAGTPANSALTGLVGLPGLGSGLGFGLGASTGSTGQAGQFSNLASLGFANLGTPASGINYAANPFIAGDPLAQLGMATMGSGTRSLFDWINSQMALVSTYTSDIMTSISNGQGTSPASGIPGLGTPALGMPGLNTPVNFQPGQQAPPVASTPATQAKNKKAKKPKKNGKGLSNKVPPQIKKWEPLIMKAAKKYEIDPALIAAVIRQESNGDPKAGSPVGATGLMQFMKETAKGFGLAGDNFDHRTDPAKNIDAGARFLRNLKRDFSKGGRSKGVWSDNNPDIAAWKAALAHYNGGYRGVSNPVGETRHYVPAVLKFYREYKA